MKVLLPGGIGDSVWGLTKVESVRDALCPGEPIDVYLSGANTLLESRALDFVRRFKFVSSCQMRPYSIHPLSRPVDPSGRYNYLDDGWYEFPAEGGHRMERVCALMPNGPLERGVRLEDWLPKYPIRWDLWGDFEIMEEEHEYGERVRNAVGDYACFYLGPLHGNTADGHNRGPLWRPEEWIKLGRLVREQTGLSIVVLGAPYDASYLDQMILPHLGDDFGHWTSLIGRTSIGQLYAVTQRARFLISYQSGVGIVSALRGTPTAIWWRPEGDSISPSTYLSFDEKMSHCWASPRILERNTYLPMIYRRHTVDVIIGEIERRQWCNMRGAGSLR